MKRAAVLFLFLTTFASLPAAAWTRTSDERIARKAAALAPPDLRFVLEKYEAEYLRGLEVAQTDEGGEGHRYIVLSRSGTLRQRIERETANTISMIRKREPMSRVAERLGVLAHLVADANNPFHVATDDALSPAHDDFERYFERRLTKFPTVFYGVDPQFQMGPFLDRTFGRAARFYPILREEYLPGGASRSSAEFDDRSTAFGIASVSYSRTVTDLVNLYYHVWRQAGGDVRSASLMKSGNLLLNP